MVSSFQRFTVAKAQTVELEQLKIFKGMAVALSHEINNPLTTLYGCLHVLRSEADSTRETVSDSLSRMRAELDRVRQITEKLARPSRVAETSYHRDVTMIDLHNIR